MEAAKQFSFVGSDSSAVVVVNKAPQSRAVVVVDDDDDDEGWLDTLPVTAGGGRETAVEILSDEDEGGKASHKSAMEVVDDDDESVSLIPAPSGASSSAVPKVVKGIFDRFRAPDVPKKKKQQKRDGFDDDEGWMDTVRGASEIAKNRKKALAEREAARQKKRQKLMAAKKQHKKKKQRRSSSSSSGEESPFKSDESTSSDSEPEGGWGARATAKGRAASETAARVSRRKNKERAPPKARDAPPARAPPAPARPAARVVVVDEDSSDEEEGVGLISCDECGRRVRRAALRPEIVASEGEIAQACRESLQLRPHQHVGVNWLLMLEAAGVCGILADDMGLGKTVQTVAYLCVARKRRREGRQKLLPDLVVAPASTLDNWKREVSRFSTLRCLVYRGTAAERADIRSSLLGRGDDDDEYPVDLVVTAYAFWERDTGAEDRAFFLRGCFSSSSSSFNNNNNSGSDTTTLAHLVLDEGHSLKNPNAKRTARLRELGKRCASRLILSGTPVQNEPADLKSLISFLMPDMRLPKNDDDDEAIKKALAPLVLRRVKADVSDALPPKHDELISVDLGPDQRRIYDDVLERHASRRAADAATQGGRKTTTTKQATNEAIFTDLRKAANHPLLLRRRFTTDKVERIARAAHRQVKFGPDARLQMIRAELESYSDMDLHHLCLDLAGCDDLALPREALLAASAKFDTVAQLLPALKAEGHRVLLFSQWTRILDLLDLLCRDALHLKTCRLDGDTDVAQRQRLVDDFNDPHSNLDVFLLSTRAGGLGINLVGADTVLIFDSDWNPEIDRQAEDRAHRIGQAKPVTVYRLVANATVDADINRVATKKRLRNNALLSHHHDKAHNNNNNNNKPPRRQDDDLDDDEQDDEVSNIAAAVRKALRDYQDKHGGAPADTVTPDTQGDDDDDEASPL